MPKPNPTRQRVLAHSTPDLDDLFFWEHVTLSRKDHLALKADEDFAYGTAHPDGGAYPNHELVYLKHDPLFGPGEEDVYRYRAYYAAVRNSQDDYNFEFTVADIGGTEFDAVARTYVVKRADFNPVDPAMGANMALNPAAVFGPDGGAYAANAFALANRKQQRLGAELDALFVVERRVYVRRTSITSLGYDELTNSTLYATKVLYYGTETVASGKTAAQLFADPTHSYWGLQSTGVVREGKQLSANWYQIVSKQVMPSTYTDGTTAIRTYKTSRNYYWPPVLESIEVMDWALKGDDPDLADVFRYYARPVYSKHAYRGPTQMQVELYWQPTPFTLGQPAVMRPLPIVYPSPILPVNIAPCLHVAMSLSSDTGSNDPTYAENAGSTRIYEATEPTDWSDDFVVEDSQAPFRGGYLRTRVKAFKPY